MPSAAFLQSTNDNLRKNKFRESVSSKEKTKGTNHDDFKQWSRTLTLLLAWSIQFHSSTGKSENNPLTAVLFV